MAKAPSRGVKRVLKRRGPDWREPDALEQLRAGSQQGLATLGPRAGQPVRSDVGAQ